MRAPPRRNDDPEAASRPFDAERDGFVMGEAGAIVVLEELEHARKRDAKIYAELGGYGISSDAQHITEPDPTGQHPPARCAWPWTTPVGPEDIDYINAHGTSTPLGDASETRDQGRARRGEGPEDADLLDEGCDGHRLGASGAIEAITSIFAVQRDVVPPTINYEYPDPKCDLDYIPNESRARDDRRGAVEQLRLRRPQRLLVIKKFRAEPPWLTSAGPRSMCTTLIGWTVLAGSSHASGPRDADRLLRRYHELEPQVEVAARSRTDVARRRVRVAPRRG